MVAGARTRAAALAAGLTACGPPASYDAAIFGDVPYSDADVAKYLSMITEINAGTFTFASHLGDIKSSLTPCTEERLATETDAVRHFEDPLVYTPGDNEWSDCTNRLFWLDRIREVVFRGTGTSSHGLQPDLAHLPGGGRLPRERPLEPGGRHVRDAAHGRWR